MNDPRHDKSPGNAPVVNEYIMHCIHSLSRAYIPARFLRPGKLFYQLISQLIGSQFIFS